MNDIEDIRKELHSSLDMLQAGENSSQLQDIKVMYLGKKGKISGLMKMMGKLSPEERKEFGKQVNALRDEAETAFNQIQNRLEEEVLEQKVKASTVDPSLPGVTPPLGTIHPMNLVRNEIIEFFRGLNFEIVSGPEVDTDWYNFEALNVPQDHPARDLQDTFYVDDQIVLRTQTSNVQIHVMESRKPPLRMISPGYVYRVDNDASHAPMFQQAEGLVVDEDVSFAELKGVLYLWAQKMFGKDVKLRFRPSFFPFTEPSAEMDVACVLCGGKGCRVCKHTGWLEIGGCGSVDPNVFEKTGLDPEKYTGFAFGIGIDRITMLKYSLPEIGLLTRSDNRFLRQFQR